MLCGRPDSPEAQTTTTVCQQLVATEMQGGWGGPEWGQEAVFRLVVFGWLFCGIHPTVTLYSSRSDGAHRSSEEKRSEAEKRLRHRIFAYLI